MQLYQKPKAGLIINDSLQFISLNWRQLLICYLTICTPFVLTIIVFAHFYPAPAHERWNMHNALDLSFNWSDIEALRFLLVNGSRAAIVVTTFAYIQLYYNLNTQPSIQQIWVSVRDRYVTFYFVLILIDLIGRLSFKLFVIPAIYLMPVLVMFPAVKWFENLSMSDTVGRSFAIIKNNWGLTLGLILIIPIVLVIPEAAIYKILALTVTDTVRTFIVVPIAYIFNFILMGLVIIIAFCYFALTSRDTTLQ